MATSVIAPTDVIGDREGLSFDPATSSVTTPAVFDAAYRQWVDGGWGSLSAPTEHGGGGLPRVVGLAVQEMMASANLSLSLSPVLTQGSVEALSIWGTADQQARYLPRLITGEWNGTMHLTEPDAGSDVGAVRTTATPARRRYVRAAGHQDLHHVGRARPDGQHRPPGPRPAPRVRRPAHAACRCSWCPSSWSTPTVRSVSATPSTASASSTRSASTPAPRASWSSTAPSASSSVTRAAACGRCSR